jgi:hypothetical protein
MPTTRSATEPFFVAADIVPELSLRRSLSAVLAALFP